MIRREWQAAIASVVLWSGAASAQAPALVPGEAASVVTIRTAGQPDRKLQVLKTERLPDGKYLTEVKDLASGAIFTIADTKPLGVPEATKLPVGTPAAPATPTLLPGTTVPATGGLPQAKARNADPLLGGSPAAAAGTTRPSTTPVQPEIPTLVGRLKKTSAPAAATATPAAPSTQSGVSKALFGDYNSVPATQPTLAGRFSEPTNAKPATTTVATAPAATPTLMGKLFGDTSSAPAQPLVASKPAPTTTVAKAPTATVFRPNAVPEPVRTTAIAAPVMPAVPPVQTVAVATPKMVPAQPVEQVSLQPTSTDPRDPNFHVVPVKAMTMKQIEDLVKDLRMHHKPSQRVEAAKALAASPMAAMVEVRQILAEASYRDPEPVVRANCIDLLAKMQYDEPNYRKYVEGLVNDDEPAVQRAAKASMR